MDFQTAVQLILIALVTYAVTQGIKALSPLVKVDLSGAVVPLIAVGTALVTAFSPGLLALIPAEYQPLVATIVIALAGSIGAAGVHSTVAKLSASPPTTPAA